MSNTQFSPIVVSQNDAKEISNEIRGISIKPIDYRRNVQALLNASRKQYESSNREKFSSRG